MELPHLCDDHTGIPEYKAMHADIDRYSIIRVTLPMKRYAMRASRDASMPRRTVGRPKQTADEAGGNDGFGCKGAVSML